MNKICHFEPKNISHRKDFQKRQNTFTETVVNLALGTFVQLMGRRFQFGFCFLGSQ